jgi:5-(carboxyamino)imidazole ribonucleotide synthase
MKSILILGSGQLGLMMATHAGQLGLQVDRLDTNSCELLPGSSQVRIKTTLEHLLAQYDVITAEIEHLPSTDFFNTLYQSSAWINNQAFTLLPDRNQQKKLLDKLGIPTAHWQFINSQKDLLNATTILGEKLVVKITQGGYDGRGQWTLPNQQPPAELYGQLIAEQRIPFLQEVSLIGARNRRGQFCFLPLSRNIHQEGVLRFTIAGSTFKRTIQQQTEALLIAIMEHLNYVGIMAMECFLTEEGLLVNELAPRVHNSGHWSQLGAELNQFSLHIHALLDLPLPRQPIYRPVIMLNLIGCEFNPEWLTISGVQCHWYGKNLRQGRKLGHINIDASSDAQLKASTYTLLPLLDDTHRSILKKAIECV